MPYYGGRGDYYGGTPRGDPFIWGAVGALAGRALGALGGLVGKVAPKVAQTVMKYPATTGTAVGLAARGFASGGPTLQGGGPLVVPGGRSIRHPFAGGRNVDMVPRGYHVNKETYVTRGGGTSQWPTSVLVHEKGTVAVKNRRMNVGNGRALVRAVRRMHAFAKMARHAIAFTSPRPPKGRLYFKRRRK